MYICSFLSYQEFLSLVAASPSPSLAHGVKTSVLLFSEARRCLLQALSSFCSAVLTSHHSAVFNVDEVFCQHDLSLAAICKFPHVEELTVRMNLLGTCIARDGQNSSYLGVLKA